MPIKVGYEGGRTGQDWGAWAASVPGPQPPPGGGGIIYNEDIVALRSDPNSLEELATVTLPTLTFLFIVIDLSDSHWQLVTGAADAGDPDGEVAPLDYNVVTNNRHWAKTG